MTLLADVFRGQARTCAQLGSPFMERLLILIADSLAPGSAVMDRLLSWPGDTTSRGASVPLRLAGGLHALVLTGAAPELAALYPPHEVSDDRLRAVLVRAMHEHAKALMAWLDRPPQTNEVRRSVALIPVAQMLMTRYGLPLTLSEVGASAGLNLNFDRFALEVEGQRSGPSKPALMLQPDWSGPAPEGKTLHVAERRGCDLTPLTGPDATLRLRAYLWPDQPDRAALLDAAVACGPAPVDAMDVADWLPGRLARDTRGTCHLIYHTIAWQYLPRKTQTNCAAMIEAAGAAATPDAPLAWFGMEADDMENGAGLTLRLWPDGLSLDLGRADFHGRWIRWQPQEM